MGTSSSGGGPIGRTPLLPSWATEDGDIPEQNDDQHQGADSSDNSEDNKEGETTTDYADNLRTAKGALTRIANGTKGASFNKAAKDYVRRIGGYKNATRASSTGISAGGNYLSFLGGVSNLGLNQVLRNYDLADCIGKSSEEVFARIADKIAPAGTTNDEAIARTAIMIAFDRLCEKLIEKDQDISELDQLDETMLKETVIEFVSAYIFKKWVYEAGLALEKNDLSESEAIELENEMKGFVNQEVKSSIGKMEIKSLDLTGGEGKKVIQDIFDLAYSTLER